MPIGLEQHLRNLHAEDVTFEPYVRARGPGEAFTTLDGAPPVRSPRRERDRLARYWDRLDRGHRAKIEALAGRVRPIHPDCRVVVQVPARFEARYLHRFLMLFGEQRDARWGRLSTDTYEVLILNNYLHGEQPDASEEVVARYRKEAGSRADNVHFVSTAFDVGEKYPLTLARRYLADIAICRLLSGGSFRRPTYFALEDADLIWVDPRQTYLQMDILDRLPYLDAVRGQQDRCPWIMCENDLLMLLRRSWNITEAYLSRRSLWPDVNPEYDFNWNRVVTSGWNSAVTAEAFALINGYTPDRRMGEDVDIGERISCVRGRASGSRFVPEVGTVAGMKIRAEGSPRRWLLRVVADIEPYDRTNQYQNFFSNDVLTELRSSSYDDLLERARSCARISRRNIDLFERALTKDWQFTLRVRRDPPKAEKQYRFVMAMLGFGAGDWRFAGERIEILKTEAVQMRLEASRARSRGRAPASFVPRRTQGFISWRSFSG